MKAIKYLAAIVILAGLAACQDETYMAPEVTPEEEFVEVTFDVMLPEPVPMPTRAAMSENPALGDPFDLYLCLYGAGNGYVQNWIPAQMVSQLGDTYLTGATYKVKLPLTTERRIVHLIVNPPAPANPTTSDYIDNVMENMVDVGGECSYWQQVELPHIKKDNHGNVENASVKPLHDGVRLVRNFSKIVVRSAEEGDADYKHFKVLQWTLINVPDRGYVAPYTGDAASRFPQAYLEIGAPGPGAANLYENLTNRDHYAGYMPPEAKIVEDFPGEPGAEGAQYAGNGEALYMYERPVPVADEYPQTSVLVQIEFDEDYEESGLAGESYWYKVEVLNDQAAYVPFFRNVVYQIKIDDLEVAGEATAEAAFNGPSFGNISASLETASLNDLSNGKSLIHVDELDYTFLTGGQEEVLWNASTNSAAQYFFVPDIAVGDKYVATTAGICTVTTSRQAVAGYDHAISSFRVGEGGVIYVTLNPTDDELKKSVIRVAGKAAFEGASELYRDITINLMKKQDFKHGDTNTAFDEETLPTDLTGVGKEIDILLQLPEGLGSSVFPLQVRIEAENNSLSATSADLPAKTGPSVFDPARNTYFFIYTIKYSDYCHLNPRTRKYDYTYRYPITFFTSKSGSNATKIDIRDLGGKFNPKLLGLGVEVEP